jgi:hypothetical protein
MCCWFVLLWPPSAIPDAAIRLIQASVITWCSIKKPWCKAEAPVIDPLQAIVCYKVVNNAGTVQITAENDVKIRYD